METVLLSNLMTKFLWIVSFLPVYHFWWKVIKIKYSAKCECIINLGNNTVRVYSLRFLLSSKDSIPYWTLNIKSEHFLLKSPLFIFILKVKLILKVQLIDFLKLYFPIIYCAQQILYCELWLLIHMFSGVLKNFSISWPLWSKSKCLLKAEYITSFSGSLVILILK